MEEEEEADEVEGLLQRRVAVLEWHVGHMIKHTTELNPYLHRHIHREMQEKANYPRFIKIIPFSNNGSLACWPFHFINITRILLCIPLVIGPCNHSSSPYWLWSHPFLTWPHCKRSGTTSTVFSSLAKVRSSTLRSNMRRLSWSNQILPQKSLVSSLFFPRLCFITERQWRDSNRKSL